MYAKRNRNVSFFLSNYLRLFRDIPTVFTLVLPGGGYEIFIYYDIIIATSPSFPFIPFFPSHKNPGASRPPTSFSLLLFLTSFPFSFSLLSFSSLFSWLVYYPTLPYPTLPYNFLRHFSPLLFLFLMPPPLPLHPQQNHLRPSPQPLFYSFCSLFYPFFSLLPRSKSLYLSHSTIFFLVYYPPPPPGYPFPQCGTASLKILPFFREPPGGGTARVYIHIINTYIHPRRFAARSYTFYCNIFTYIFFPQLYPHIHKCNIFSFPILFHFSHSFLSYQLLT